MLGSSCFEPHAHAQACLRLISSSALPRSSHHSPHPPFACLSNPLALSFRAQALLYYRLMILSSSTHTTPLIFIVIARVFDARYSRKNYPPTHSSTLCRRTRPFPFVSRLSHACQLDPRRSLYTLSVFFFTSTYEYLILFCVLYRCTVHGRRFSSFQLLSSD